MTRLSEIFKGAKHHSGVMTSQGSVYEQKSPIDWDSHIKGELVQGLSPVNEDTREVEFYGVDIDIKIDPKEITDNVWNMIGTEYRCIMTKSKRWRVIGWFDKPTDVTLAKAKAKELEEKIEKILLYKCDKGHTLPTIPGDNKPGAWWFMPYHNEYTCAYGPGGIPLTQEQFYFSWKYRKYPLIASTVGKLSSTEDGKSRHKALFNCALNIKHDETLEVTLEEINQHFGKPLVDDLNSTPKVNLAKDIAHALKSAEKKEYDKDYFLKNFPYYVKAHCGVLPYINDKVLFAVSQEITDQNVYVIKRVDFWNFKENDWFTKEQMNDTWAHYTKGKNVQPMSRQLLESENIKKVKSYLCHAGLKPGVIEIKPREVPGIEPGLYLNTYRPVNIESIKGDTKGINEYYTWLIGEDNWNTIKQVLKFMLEKPGSKIMWCIVIKGKVQGAGKGLLALLMESIFGSHNVKINVTFNDLTRDHSTIVDGKQIIVLNELVLSGGGKEGKVLSNKIKPYITDPTLIINPKGKQEIEIPNFCNFFMFSNDRKPMKIDPEDRRLFVITIDKKKFEVRKKLDDDGYKKEIFKHVKNPGAFKWHLLNEVTIEDESMFFTDPPMNKDKEQLIKDSMDDFEKKIWTSFDERRFPFQSKTWTTEDTWAYQGLINRDDLDSALKRELSYRGTYWDLSKLDEILDEIHIKKVQVRCSDGTRPRVHIIEDVTTKDGKKYTEMSQSELGAIYEKGGYKGKDELKSTEVEWTDINERHPDHARFEDRFKRKTVCWSCKEEISTEVDGACPKCTTGIPCGHCGACICERPKEDE